MAYDVEIDGVIRESWDTSLQPPMVQFFNGDGTPMGDPVEMTPEQVQAVNQKVERAQLFTAALQAYTINEQYLALVSTGTATTAQTIQQVGRLTEQVNALMKLVIVDILKVPGSGGQSA